jgi:CshA-type fibril repeat protein
MGSARQLYHLFEIPTAAGGVGGICATTSNCYSQAGASVALNSGLASWYDGVGDTFNYAEHALRQGSRLYRGDGNGATGGARFSCWDQASNSGIGAICANWPISVTNYAIALDPLNDNCIWKNDHFNSIKAYDARTATENCTTPPSRVVIPAETAVPRMACSTPESGVREWRSIKLLAPSSSGYTGAALTILDSSGAEISGWTDRTFDTANDRLIDLASLSVATTGQKPTFIVQYTGLTSATNTSVEIVAVGDSPELCLHPEAIATCPVISSVGLQPDSPSTGSFTVLGDGSSTSGGGTTPYSQGSTSVTVDAGPSPTCGAQLTGRALSNDANTLPIPEATVALLDSNGVALNYPVGHPQAGTPITTTTNSTGNYSFGLLAAGSYKVKFINTPTTTVQNSRKIASSAGPGAWSDSANASGSGAARAVISPTTAITNAGPGVVNGYFSVPPVAPSRTAAATKNATVTFDPFTPSGSSPAATPSSASSFTSAAKAQTRLCGPSETAPACSQTSLTTLQGTWSVVTASGADQGKISFTPINDFNGTVTPVTYSVTDAASQKASGTLTPSYPAPPSAQDDTSSGAWGVNQTIDVLTNDSAGSGVTLSASTMKLCPQPVPSAPFTAVNCNETSVAISGEGTYTANSDGTVTFDPESTFIGQAETSVRYVVQDSLGQVGSALITPSVSPPGASAATSDSTIGIVGASQSVDLLVNDSAPVGATFTSSSTRLCSPGTSAPDCVSTTVNVANVGTYSLSNGTVTFMPCTTAVTANCISGMAFTGTADDLGYQVTDSLNRIVSSTYSPTVVPAPVANPDAQTSGFDVDQNYTPASNDTAGSGTTIVATSVRLCPTASTAPFDGSNCAATQLTTADGVYALDTDTGTVTFDPASTFSGVALEPVNYVVADALGQYASSTITPTVTPPGASAAIANTSLDVVGATHSVDLLANDIVPNGVTLMANSTRLCASGTNAPNCASISVDVPNVGTYALSNGTVAFTPCTVAVTANCSSGAAYSGSPTALGYQVTDSLGRVVSSTYTPTVVPLPTAVADAQTGGFDVNQTYTPSSNDTAGLGTTLDGTSVRLCATNATAPFTPNNCSATSVTTPDGVYALDSATGVVTFDPANTFTGPATVPVKYVVADGLGQYASSTITPTVTPPALSVATSNTTTGIVGASQIVNLLTNDSAPNGVTLTASSTRLCAPGTNAPNCVATTVDVTNVGTYSLMNSTVTFIPCTSVITVNCTTGTAFTGTPTALGYQVSDSLNRVVNSTYTPTVVPPPTASGDGSQGVKGQPQTIALITNDVPGDGVAPLDPTTIRLCDSSETAPNCTLQTLTISGEGTYTINPSGTVTFTPDRDFVGSSTPQRYVVADILGQVTDATIQPNVVPPPAPITADDSEIGPADTPMTIDPLANDSAGTLPAGLSGEVNLVRSSLRLCDRSELAPNCTATQLTTADGTYTVDTATGFVTFTPRNGFTGQVTQPVTYQIANDWTGPSGVGIATAVITPIIDPAAPPAPLPAIAIGGGSSTSSSSLLPQTGSDLLITTLWAAVLIGLGSLLMVFGLRSR